MRNALLVPLIQDESEVDALEAVNREEHPSMRTTGFLLSSMAETISNALENASPMTAERKVEILGCSGAGERGRSPPR